MRSNMFAQNWRTAREQRDIDECSKIATDKQSGVRITHIMHIFLRIMHISRLKHNIEHFHMTSQISWEIWVAMLVLHILEDGGKSPKP